MRNDEFYDDKIDEGVFATLKRAWSDALSDMLASPKGVALLTVAVGFLSTVPLSPLPLALPGGGVATPASLAGLAYMLLLVSVAALLSAALARIVPGYMAVCAAGSLPGGVISLTLLWGVSVLVPQLVSALVAGLCVWLVLWRRDERGPLPLLCAVLFLVCMSSLGLAIGGRWRYLRHPDTFSVSYARVDAAGDEGEAPEEEGLAWVLADAVLRSGVENDCDAVMVTPFCLDRDGRYMSWRSDPEGSKTLVVCSAFVQNYTVDELKKGSVQMLSLNENTALLHTRWTDMPSLPA